MVKLYTENFERKFYVRTCSWTHLFYVLTLISVIVLPLLIGIGIGKFWKPTVENYWQPNVEFTNEVFIQADVGGKILSYSSQQVINQSIRDRINGALFKSYALDDNDNRIPENFEFDFSFKTGGSSVSSIMILLHFKYFVYNTVKTQFKGIVPIFISSAAGSSITDAYLIGELKINQDDPLEISNGIPDTMYNYNFTEQLTNLSSSDTFMKYTSRNQTLNFDHKATVNSFGSSATTTVHIEMKIPKYSPALYVPSLIQALKIAWIQYYPVLFPIYLLLLVGLFGTSITSSVFDTIATNDISASLKHKLES